VYTFRKSWKYFEAAISYRKKLDESHPLAREIDTYLQTSVGFFHFIIGVVPKEFQWLAEVTLPYTHEINFLLPFDEKRIFIEYVEGYR